MRKYWFLLAFLIISTTAVAKQAISPFTYEQICKAAISANVSTKPKNMKSSAAKNEIYKVSYTRDDGNKYTYVCKFEGNQVRWKDSTMSKWNKNVKIYFKVNNKELNIKSDMLGTIFEKTFKMSDF